jgi:hypothetical protein
MDSITNEDKLKCAKRELAMRLSAYPKWIQSGRLKPETAAHEISVMRAIVEDYEKRIEWERLT